MPNSLIDQFTPVWRVLSFLVQLYHFCMVLSLQNLHLISLNFGPVLNWISLVNACVIFCGKAWLMQMLLSFSKSLPCIKRFNAHPIAHNHIYFLANTFLWIVLLLEHDMVNWFDHVMSAHAYSTGVYCIKALSLFVLQAFIIFFDTSFCSISFGSSHSQRFTYHPL